MQHNPVYIPQQSGCCFDSIYKQSLLGCHPVQEQSAAAGPQSPEGLHSSRTADELTLQ